MVSAVACNFINCRDGFLKISIPFELLFSISFSLFFSNKIINKMCDELGPIQGQSSSTSSVELKECLTARTLNKFIDEH